METQSPKPHNVLKLPMQTAARGADEDAKGQTHGALNPGLAAVEALLCASGRKNGEICTSAGDAAATLQKTHGTKKSLGRTLFDGFFWSLLTRSSFFFELIAE